MIGGNQMPKTAGEDLFMGFRLIETNNGEIKGSPARVWGMGIDPDDGVPVIFFDGRNSISRITSFVGISRAMLPQFKERENNCLLIGINDDVHLVDAAEFDAISDYMEAIRKGRDPHSLNGVIKSKSYHFINGGNGKSNILFEV
jgi:hypothetical protein